MTVDVSKTEGGSEVYEFEEEKEKTDSLINTNTIGTLVLFLGVAVFNLMSLGDMERYLLEFDIHFYFRTQLFFNLTKAIFGSGTNIRLELNLGTINLGDIYYVLLFAVLGLVVALAGLLAVILFNHEKEKAQFLLKNSHVIVLFFAVLQMMLAMEITKVIPLADPVEDLINFLRENLGFFLNDLIGGFIRGIITDLSSIIILFPPIVVMIVFGLLSYYISGRKLALSLAVVFIFALVEGMGFWSDTIETIVLIIFASFLCVVTGIPLGIMAAKNDTVLAIVRPILDFMQTLPAFVYLIPAMFLFSIGTASGIVATYIFAVPPAVRLTNLGIRQVPLELIEVSEAYGCTPWQKLVKVELPVAFPSIMAGVNQVIMLALSMVVVAALIASPGLGVPVVQGLQTLDIPLGFGAGLCIVLLAMVLDRITSARVEF